MDPAPIPKKEKVCLTPEFLQEKGLPVPANGAAEQMMVATNPSDEAETMEVPVKIALNGWTSADFHSYLAKVRARLLRAGNVVASS